MPPATSQPSTTTSPFPEQLNQLKLEADLLLQQISSNFDCQWPETFTKFIINMMTNFNHSFVSQYTILYKSYMIVTAMVLAMVCNMVWMWMYAGQRSGIYNGMGELEWLHFFVHALPLKGRFSIVFFQLMFITSLQIVYETVIELHYRFSKRRNKFLGGRPVYPSKSQSVNSNDNTKSQKPTRSQSKSKPSQQPSDRQRRQQKQPSEQEQTRIHCDSQKIFVTPNLEYWQQNYIMSALLKMLFIGIDNSDKLPETFKAESFRYHPRLSSAKLLYVFSLLYMENVIWEGIIVKQWKQRFVHLVILLSCVAEFAIWNVINLVMERGINVTFGGKHFVEVASRGDISLGLY